MDGQKMLDHITSETCRKSKCVWSKCVLCIPYILSGNPNECWLHTCTCDRFVITTWRLGLWAPLQSFYLLGSWFEKFTTWVWCLSLVVQYRSKVFSWHWILDPHENRESSQVNCCVLILDSCKTHQTGTAFCLQSIIKGFVLSVICSLLSILVAARIWQP